MEKDYLIKKWLNDDLTLKELEAFRALDGHSFYVDILETAKYFKVSDQLVVDDYEDLHKKLKIKKNTIVKSILKHPLLRIASVLVIVFVLYFTLFYNVMTTVATLAHQKTTVELPDGSNVTLNALSTIEFNKENWNKKRLVNLKGEAFFKVQKGHVFDVVTTNGTVTVVGTQFSVTQRDDYFQVTCFEGIVKVASKTASTMLKAGQTIRILNGYVSEDTTVDQRPEWLGNTSSFKALPFDEVVRELERQYGIEITLEAIKQNPLFTGGFVHDNLDNALISITQPLNLTYKILSPKQVVIYGHKK